MKTPMTDELDEVSCVMSDEETVKAYKKLCRTLEEQAGKWQAVAEQMSAEREHNANEAQKWRAVAEGLAAFAREQQRTSFGMRYDEAVEALAAFEQANGEVYSPSFTRKKTETQSMQ